MTITMSVKILFGRKGTCTKEALESEAANSGEAMATHVLHVVGSVPWEHGFY